MDEDFEYDDAYKEPSKDKVKGENSLSKSPLDIENIYQNTDNKIPGIETQNSPESKNSERFKAEVMPQIAYTGRNSLNSLTQGQSILSNKPKMKLSSKTDFENMVPKEVSSGLKTVKQESILSNKRRPVPNAKTNSNNPERAK